mmetsp:Transcript_17877/g.26625  ORF Transcript_17877/g.26625 Transcript_17877/m.26625 type:complete len:179 (+) Transcript_17877:94-630(+)
MFGAAREKCTKCGKTVYATEKLNILNQIWHKWCFKCETCSKRLTMQTFKGVQGHIYCEGCRPKPQATQTADRHDLNTIKAAPKVDVVNEQVRGGEVAQRGGKITSDSMSVRTAKEAPKIARVNDQVRGEMAGQGGKIDSTAMYISNARNAPKADDGAQLGKRLADAGQTSKPNTGQMA